MKRPVIYVKAKYHDELNLSEFPSSGKYPNITGMRRIYGEHANLVMCCNYLYNVDAETYEKAAQVGR